MLLVFVDLLKRLSRNSRRVPFWHFSVTFMAIKITCVLVLMYYTLFSSRFIVCGLDNSKQTATWNEFMQRFFIEQIRVSNLT